ncbi:MAG: PA14 domain-containing protein [Chloroflexota bacterium]
MRKIGLSTVWTTLLFVLTGCLSNFPDLLVTPTPTPTNDPNFLISPDINLDPVGGYSGTYVNVEGEGWLPGKLVILKLEDTQGQSGILTANIPDAQGRFEAGFAYPGTERWNDPGIYTIVAYTLNEDLGTSTQFVVIVPTVLPDITATNTRSATPTATATITAPPTASPQPAATATITQPTATPFQFLLLPTATPTFTPTFIPTATLTVPPIDSLTATLTVTPTQVVRSTQTPQSAIGDGEVTVVTSTVINNPGQAAGDARDTATVVPIVTPELTTPITTSALITPTLLVASNEVDASSTTTSSTIEVLPPASTQAAEAPPIPPTSTPTWTPAPVVVVIQEWRGDYWANPNLDGDPTLIQNDQIISFEWGSESPSSEIPEDNFSARWSRSIYFEAGSYTFQLEVDDGARLLIDGQLLIDSWQDGSRRQLTAQTVLNQGQHQIILEYYERTGNALVHLSWEEKANFVGWRGEYFANQSLSGRPALLRDDGEINFNWGTDSPNPSLPADQFSARWQRTQFFQEGLYRFTATADDGIRMWINGALILDEWRDQAAETFVVDLPIEEGTHELLVEYYENTLGAIVQMDWERISTSLIQLTPTWTPKPATELAPTPTWTPKPNQPTPTWTPQN